MASWLRVARWAAACGFLALVVPPACSATEGKSDGFGSGGTGGSAAADGSASGGASATGGTLATGGTGGALGTGGAGNSPGDSGSDAPNDGVFNDAPPDVITGDACTDAGQAPGPYPRRCAAAASNECAGGADVNAALPNGAYGNGFDDDCDGLVDEGCACDPSVAAGGTKKCSLASASQVDGSGQAVGWCRTASVGTERCVAEGTGEFVTLTWDGQCRGAQLPYPDDVCALGDFDCDGLDANSRTENCCQPAEVVCPTDTIVTTPFPVATALPFLDGSGWIKNTNPALATNWTWTATGGDCDDVLPHPSFMLFKGPSGTGVVPAVECGGPTQPACLGQPAGHKGESIGPAQGSTNRVYAAFALSGDYLVTGTFTLSGKQYSCTTRIAVRAPGIRAELCWTPQPNDVDLHFARLQSPDACTAPSGGGSANHGWFQTCREDPSADDCYYLNCKTPMNWSYADSPTTACHGWGSRRGAAATCANPRLDFDNVDCDLTIRNPNGLFGIPEGFCGAENTNIDNPRNGDRFAVGAHAYSTSGVVQPHVNIYCNGERRLSVGYLPGGQAFPKLLEPGAQFGGDFWEVAIVEAVVDGSGQLTDCKIDPVPSLAPKNDKDGSAQLCVDTDPKNSGQNATDNRSWSFTPSGGFPATASALCWH